MIGWNGRNNCNRKVESSSAVKPLTVSTRLLKIQAPLLAVYPGVAIALAVLGLNLLGDGLRDLFDPRLARKR